MTTQPAILPTISHEHFERHLQDRATADLQQILDNANLRPEEYSQEERIAFFLGASVGSSITLEYLTNLIKVAVDA